MSGIRIPEHDLEPPKFARKALEMALGNWEVVSILLKMGLKNQAEDEVPILESTFHLAAHHGSTQLDKFVFTLLAWCEESSLDILLNLFVQQEQTKAGRLRSAHCTVHTLIQHSGEESGKRRRDQFQSLHAARTMPRMLHRQSSASAAQHDPAVRIVGISSGHWSAPSTNKCNRIGAEVPQQMLLARTVDE